MMHDPERIPVIIGVGQVNDRPVDPDDGLDSLGLMAQALREAEIDAGCNVLAQLDSLAIVDQISFRQLGNLCAPLAAEIGAAPRVLYQSEAPHGDTPIRLLNEAANRIGAGEIALAAVVGGEALRTAAGRLAKSKREGSGGAPFDAARAAASRAEPNYAQRYGLVAPVDVYPLYENATRAAWGQTLTQAQEESGAIWSLMSEVAQGQDGAWLRKAVSAEEIVSPGPRNRPLAHPYTKLMVANSSVNQGAGFIIASLAEARRRGIAVDRLVYVGMGAAAKEPKNVLMRDRFDQSVSIETSIRQTLKLNQMSGDNLDLVELYSCFPCVPKMARRVLGWPVEKPATVFGGLTFGGGPIANYMSHAIVAMTLALRKGARNGFLFANGGYATDNHCIVLSRDVIGVAQFPQDFDCQALADSRRGAIPELDRDFAGPARVDSFTVFHDREGAPTGGVVVAMTPHGTRTLAHIDAANPEVLAYFTDGQCEPVGGQGTIAEVAGLRVFMPDLAAAPSHRG